MSELKYFDDQTFFLDAVDFERDDISDKDASCIRFRLDGVVYIAVEDPDDGYRSYLDEIMIGDKITNQFEKVLVRGKYRERNDGGNCSIIQFFDQLTNLVVLEIGTENTDDYYPYFVANFSPENMSINKKAAEQIDAVLAKKLLDMKY